MSQSHVYINLPVTDLTRSLTFFTELGFSFNAQFSDDTATCMTLNEGASVMLLTQNKFATFTPNSIADAHKQTEVLVYLQLNDREQVDHMVEHAVAAGGSIYNQPKDHGFMYAHGFQDLDGHIWEVMTMDEAAMAAFMAEQTVFLSTV